MTAQTLKPTGINGDALVAAITKLGLTARIVFSCDYDLEAVHLYIDDRLAGAGLYIDTTHTESRFPRTHLFGGRFGTTPASTTQVTDVHGLALFLADAHDQEPTPTLTAVALTRQVERRDVWGALSGARPRISTTEGKRYTPQWLNLLWERDVDRDTAWKLVEVYAKGDGADGAEVREGWAHPTSNVPAWVSDAITAHTPDGNL